MVLPTNYSTYSKYSVHRRLDRKGFGRYIEKSRGKKAKVEIFLKPHPDTIDKKDVIVNSLECTFDNYKAKFNDFTNVSAYEKAILLEFHPHEQLLDLLTQQESKSSEDD